MNDYKLSILFLLQRNRVNKQGKCPIRCRITYVKTRKIFSTGIFINPDYWEGGKQKADQVEKLWDLVLMHKYLRV